VPPEPRRAAVVAGTGTAAEAALGSPVARLDVDHQAGGAIDSPEDAQAADTKETGE
jgi:hypothetical protein